MMTARRMPQTPAAVDYRLLGRQVSVDMHTAITYSAASPGQGVGTVRAILETP